jgi:organic hydroperoxide reductase OsmC/OhrA
MPTTLVIIFKVLSNKIMYTYEVNLEWDTDRKGTVSSPVLPVSIEVATPPEFPKGIPDIWSPEHLFVAAVNSCLMTTFLAVAENSKFTFQHFSCNAVGKLEKVDGKMMISTITLYPEVVIDDPEQEERAIRILGMSEKACLISNSVSSKVEMEPRVVVSTLPVNQLSVN